MGIRSAFLSIDIDDGFKCPFCGRKVDTLNILLPGDNGTATRTLVGYGCCDTANNMLFDMKCALPLSNAELHELTDKAVKVIVDEGGKADKAMDTFKCCICGKEFRDFTGCNPWPVVDDEDSVCCHECDRKVVWPARSRLNKGQVHK